MKHALTHTVSLSLITLGLPLAAGLAGPVRSTQNIGPGGTQKISGGLKPGGSITVNGSGSDAVEVSITFVDANGPVDIRKRGTFTVTFPVSGSPKTSAVFFTMKNGSGQTVLYTLNAD